MAQVPKGGKQPSPTKIEYLKETREFLKSKHKTELWVTKEFLERIGLEFDAPELVPVEKDPPDVRFRDAEFEVKELLDPGRKRNGELKKAIEDAEKEPDKEEAAEWHPAKSSEPVDIFNAVEAKILDLKYEPNFRRKVDLLLYYNRRFDYFQPTEELPDTSSLSRHGFRSISVVIASLFAWVLWAEADAPKFIVDKKCKLLYKGFKDK